jgi:uncharacterized protein with ParB-like and HNH nuclease domain
MEITTGIANVLISIVFGQDYEILKSVIDKFKRQKEYQNNPDALSIKIIELTNSFKKSAELMNEVEVQFAKQKEVAMKLKEEAETNQVIASLNKKEVEAINRIISATVKGEGKKATRVTIVSSAIFCIIGLVGGLLIQNFANIVK